MMLKVIQDSNTPATLYIPGMQESTPMNEEATTTLKEIYTAAESLKKIRPAYTEIIDYYQQILIEQESAKNEIELDSLVIPYDHLKAKRKENLPLINISEFVIDRSMSKNLLLKICSITEAANLRASESAARLKAAINNDGFDFNGLSRAFLDRDGPVIHKLVSIFGVDEGFLLLATYHSLKPSFEMCAKRLSVHLIDDCHQAKGCCPICGSKPKLSLLDKEGKRYLFCSVCWHKWQIRRGFCPICENENIDMQLYFFSNDEKEYRVELCEKCKSYLKCIDSRNTPRVIYPFFELVATVHLDLRAQADGYHSSSEFVY